MKKQSPPPASIAEESAHDAVFAATPLPIAEAASVKSVSASSSEKRGPLAQGCSTGPEKERLSGGGLAIKATIRLSVISFFCENSEGQIKRCLKRGGQIVPVNRDDRESESRSWLFWAPQGLSLLRLKERLSSALPGWLITQTIAEEGDDTADLIKDGWASEAAEVHCCFQAKDALDFPWEAGMDHARAVFERELSLMCERPPLSRLVDPLDDMLDVIMRHLMPGGEQLSSMQQACQEMVVEDEKRALEASTPGRARKPRSRL